MKLDGLRVVDLSLFLPGPHLTMMMADHGADVIAVEPPGGEPVREIGLKDHGESVWFRNVARGKRSLCLNLKQPAAREVLHKLVATADVFIEAFRPGVTERLGIAYESLKELNPGLVYCSITAFGQTGPKRLKPAHDLSIQADSGLVSVNLGADGQPAQPGVPAADMAGSLMALSGILMALLRRQQTGRGDYLDISMQDSLIAWTPNVMGPVFAQQRAPEVKSERSWGGNAFYQIYQTADGDFLTLGGSEPKFVERLLTAFERPDLIESARQPPGEAHEPVKAFLAATFARHPLADWQSYLDDLDICWSPVRDLCSAIHDPHLAERGMLRKDEAGRQHLGVPIQFADEKGRPDYRLPRKGQHNTAIIKDLGYDQQAINQLAAAGAILEDE